MNHSRGVVGMGREAQPEKHPEGGTRLAWVCEKCGALVVIGFWPFCRPGHPEDHKR